MLLEIGEKQHYCWIKRGSALLFDSKINNRTHYCMLCLTRFTTAEVLEKHQEHCNGVNGRPTRIDIPKKEKNKISFQNYHKQMKIPYVIYGDFEAIIHKMQGCERPQEIKSYTEKTEQHEACGYAYKVVRYDGKVVGSRVYRAGENAVSNF